ncbi:MAG: TIGR00725 family protein [bacterium]
MQVIKARIAVIGAGSCSVETAQVAEEVGQRIAEQGGILLCGGLGGVMEAAARGAGKAGGLTVGILPGNLASQANRYIDIPVVTGIGHARNVVLVQSAQGIIAVKGEYGTLSEIAVALKENKPIVGIDTWKIKGIPGFNHPEEAVSELFKMIG